MTVLRKYGIILLLSGIVLTGCQASVRFAERKSSPSKNNSPSSNSNEKVSRNSYSDKIPVNSTRQTILREACRWVGTPYCYGGTSHSCTDCSGFVQQVFGSVNIDLPRTAEQQFGFCKRVGEEEQTAGDLVFFSNGNKISHVGIYVGNSEFIHASTSRGVVRQSLSDSYYNNNFAGFRRVVDY